MRPFEAGIGVVSDAFLQALRAGDCPRLAALLSAAEGQNEESEVESHLHGLTEGRPTTSHFYDIVCGDEDHATVHVCFDTVARPELVRLELQRRAEGWLIAEIEWGFPD